MKIRDHISESERSRFLTVLVIWCGGDIQTTATQSTRTIEYWRHPVNYDVCVSPGTGDGLKVKTWTVAACPINICPTAAQSKGRHQSSFVRRDSETWQTEAFGELINIRVHKEIYQMKYMQTPHASSSLLGNMMSWLEFYWLCIRECLWNSTRDWQTTKFYDPWPSILFSLPASETDTSSFLTIYSWWTSLLPLSLITLPPFLF